MEFTSIKFIVFFIAVVTVSFFLNPRIKEWFLLISSFAFYASFGVENLALLGIITVSSYFCAIKKCYRVGIIIPLAILTVFKYYNFFLGNLTGIIRIIMPVGISFYVFTAVSYIADCKRSKINAEYDYVKLALYLSFFPTLLSGPIQRANSFLPQLYEQRKTEWNSISEGIQIFVFGLFKKIVLADNLAVFVNNVYSNPNSFHWISVLLAVLSYSLQIYFDFSGYSDMATGCAKCLGYDIPKNFNFPYISKNVTEFWRRWHISLSTWMRDYIYIPLGGNKKGRTMMFINLFITMIIGGLWHGPNWTFVIWGALNGIALCFDKIFKLKSTFITFLTISFTWIFFRSNSVTEALTILKSITSLQNGVLQVFSWSIVSFCLLIAYYLLNIKRNSSCNYFVQDLGTVKGLSLFFVLIGLTICLSFTGEQPFIYFNF